MASESPKKHNSSSPIRVDKTLEWLETSRDRWKEKTKKAKTSLKKAILAAKRAREQRDKALEMHKNSKNNAVEELLAQKDAEIIELKKNLENMAKELDTIRKKDLAPQTGKSKGHTYWNSFIMITMTLVHAASLSFSGTAQALEVFHQYGKLDRAPAVETCIQWEMKLGLHKLTRPKAKADDWVWIADHVVSKGMYKCLVVLRVRMSQLEKKQILTISMSDVEPIAIVPMKTSNGNLINE